MLDQAIIKGMKSVFTYDFLNLVAMICLVLGIVGTGLSIRTVWAEWVVK
jgi:hypothetical protein